MYSEVYTGYAYTANGGQTMGSNYYSSTFLRRLEKRKGKPWCGVLKYQALNPDYKPDPRAENQRRKSFGKRPNDEYVPDPRKPHQRREHVSKQITRVFDVEATREILGDPNAEAPRSKSAATTVLAAWHRQMEAEHNTPDASLTVSEFVERYISTLAALYDPESTGTAHRAGISPTTACDYRGTMRYFGRGKAINDVPVRKLTVSNIEAWELSLVEDGLAGTTAAKAHRLLWSALEYAVTHDVLPKNPARGVRGPKRTSGTRPNALDVERRAKTMLILDAMAPTPLTTAARLALYLGLRRGEVCGLTWGNVDLEGVAWTDSEERGPKVRISQSVGEAGGRTYLKPPKSEAGKRVLPLKGGIVEALKARRELMWAEWSQAMESADMAPTKEAFDALYVCGFIDGRYYLPQVLTHEWGAFAKQFNLVGTEGRLTTFHGLRDSYATAAHTRGEDTATIANNLGHADPAMTLRRYASARDSAAQAATNATVASELDAARAGDVLPFVPRTGTEG